MGVHEYSCTIHGTGEQNLSIHDKCRGRNKKINHNEKYTNSDGEDESSHNEEGNGGDDGILVCFELDENVDDRRKALELFKTGKYPFRLMEPKYSWDSWDFMDNDEPMGYIRVLDNDSPGDVEDNFSLPWKTSNEFRERHPYKRKFWCMAFCHQCFNVFLTNNAINVAGLCSDYLREVCESNALNKGWKFDVYEIVREKYEWLRDIVAPKYEMDGNYVKIKFVK